MRKLIFPLSLLAVWLGACTNETNEPGEVSPEKDKVAMTFTVTGSDGAPQTRMGYKGNSNDALEIRWDATKPDAIGLFNDGQSKNVKCEVKSAEGNKAQFEDVTLTWANQPSNPAKVYAYYPYTSNASNKYVPIDLSNQMVLYLDKPLDHIGNLDFMVATADVNVSGNTPAQPLSLQFEHVLHLITFEVSGLSSDEIGPLTSITLKATDGTTPFRTEASLDLENSSYSGTTNQFTNSVTLKLNNLTVKNDEVYYFNMLVFPTMLTSSCDIIISTEHGKKRISKTFDPAYRLEKGKHTLFECKTGWKEVNFSGGNGTKEDPYLLTSSKDLQELQKIVSLSETQGQYFKLTQNINLDSNEEWTPIGSTSSPFKGIFDGNGHTISGMKISTKSTGCGFWGVIDGATIKHLNVEGNINITGDNVFVGGCVGQAKSNSSIIACSFKGNIHVAEPNGNTMTGGIVGYNSGGTTTILACYYRGIELKGGSLGGITGSRPLSLKACYSLATSIEGSSKGGLCGSSIGSLDPEYCYWLHINGIDGFISGALPATCSSFTGSSFFNESKLADMNAQIMDTGYKFVAVPNDYPVIEKIN